MARVLTSMGVVEVTQTQKRKISRLRRKYEAECHVSPIPGGVSVTVYGREVYRAVKRESA